MKRFLAIVLAMVMTASLVACGSSSSTSSSSAPAANSSSAPAAQPEAAPGFEDVTAPTDATYNPMTEEELYELAKSEGGKITVYATSSKMLKVEEPFEAAYPGLDLEVIDLDNDEVIEKCKIEAETGNITGDVLQCKDAQGSLFYEFMTQGYCSVYYPDDICANIDADLLKYGYPLYASESFWFYNTEAYPDGQPITSWWNLLETNDDGSQKYRIYTKEIGQEEAYLALFCSFIVNADQMAADYKAIYGSDLEYTYDASSFAFPVPENNAGVEYLYRFTKLNMTFIGDGDELVLAVHNSTADDPALCLASAGKISNRDESNYNIGWCTNLTPYCGIQNCEYLYVVEGCDNPAGARLLIRFITDNKDGMKPFMKEGNWPVRADKENDKNPVAKVADCGAIPPQTYDIYQIFPDVQDMWTYWLDKNK